jgi:PAS domain S-box-containing protein
LTVLPFCAVPSSDVQPPEEAVSLASVLQELTSAALDLFDPEGLLDDFLQRLTLRLGCLAALCLELSKEGRVLLLGSAGLSRASRELPLTVQVETRDGASLSEVSWGALSFPYPELTAAPLGLWEFPFTTAPEEQSLPAALLLFFDPSQRVSQQYFGLVARLVRVVRRALHHRALDARVRQSEQRLIEQKMLLEAENEATLEGILVVSLQGRILSYNRRLLELWGLTREELEGAGLIQTLLPLAVQRVRDSARFLQFVRRMLLAREQEGSEVLSLWDGRTLELFTAPLRNAQGGVSGRGWYLRDITQQRRAEEERARLLEREQAARQAAEEARQSSAFLAEASRRLAGYLEAENVLVQATRMVLPRLGDWSAALQVEGDAMRICAVAHRDPALEERLGVLLQQRVPLELPGGALRAAQTGQSVLEAGGTPDQPVTPFGLRSPEHLAVLREVGAAASLAVPLVARGVTLGVLTLVSSQPDRHYTQEERALAEDLAARVALAVDNARLYEEAQRAIRIREEFLSVAAHELFTPLTSLRLTAQSLQRTPSAQAYPSRSLLRIIDGQTRKLSRLVSELLDVSRIQAGALALEFDEIDLGQVTREVVEQFGPELERSGTPLKLEVEPGVTGWWDRLRLEQVLQNLLSNAVKYGEGKPIEVQVKEQDGMASLVIRDHGMGISPEDQARIFGPFERAISSRHFGGLGLGLYIAQRIVWQLGGSIRLHSAPGQGAVFTVELPRAAGSTRRSLPTGPEALH